MRTPSRFSSASGRRAQAKRNDERILNAARKVLLADPGARVSAVAAEAGVGMSAFYLRYRSKDQLLQRLCLEGLQRYIAEAEAALVDRGDIFAAYSTFMRRIVAADTHSLVLRLAGTFTPSKKLYREAGRSQALTVRLFERVKAARAIRSDIEVVDIAILFEQLAAVRVGGAERTAQLRQRYLTLILESLRAPATTPLPGPPPNWQEINSRWNA
jgi:AcrR family transcriptional regulator